MLKPSFINLTPHSIWVTIHPDFLDDRGIEYPASGMVARMPANRAEGPLCGPHRMVQQSFGAVEGLPEPVAGVVYIVSGIVLSDLAGSRPRRPTSFIPGLAERSRRAPVVRCESDYHRGWPRLWGTASEV